MYFWPQRYELIKDFDCKDSIRAHAVANQLFRDRLWEIIRMGLWLALARGESGHGQPGRYRLPNIGGSDSERAHVRERA
jgi:hypothetical protein